MAANLDKQHQGDAFIPQAERVGSYILQQCHNVITTFTEFSSLTYRMSQTIQDIEVMTVYRNKVMGVFGPAVEPVTLTIDPSGRCLVSVLFKPVQRVSLVSGNTGGLDVLSLLAVLRMIAGKGYLFCPGIPEKILSGKACGRYVESHRAPFKRFQSPQCPVYFQVPPEKNSEVSPETDKPPRFKMCPQCRQVASLVVRLPLAPVQSRGAAAMAKAQRQLLDAQTLEKPTGASQRLVAGDDAQPPVSLQPKPNETQQNSSAQVRHEILPPQSLPTLVTTPWPSEAAVSPDLARIQPVRSRTSVPQEQQGAATEVHSLKRSISDPDGARLSQEPGVASLAIRSNPINEALRNALLRKRIKLDPSAVSKVAKGKDEASVKARKGKKLSRNVCRICKRNFSSPASLLNHLQRHEGVSGPLKKSLKSKLSSGKHNSSLAILRMMVRGAKLHNTINKKNSSVSEMSLRLFIRCLSNLVSSANGSTLLGSENIDAETKRSNFRSPAEKQVEAEDKPGAVSAKGDETVEKPGLYQRRSSGVSAMQTLLEAAVVAGTTSGSLTTSPSSSMSARCDQEMAEFSGTSKPMADLVEESKKHRKSPRIALRLKKKELLRKEHTQEPNTSPSSPPTFAVEETKIPQPQDAHNARVSHDPVHLTNLDLLSSVSLDMEKRKVTQSLPNFLPGVVVSTLPLPLLPSSLSTSQCEPPSNGLMCRQGSASAMRAVAMGPPPLLFAKPGKDGGLVNWVPQTRLSGQLRDPGPHLRMVSPTGQDMPVPSQLDCGAMDLSKPKLPIEVAVSLSGITNSKGHSGETSDAEPPPNFLNLLSSGSADTIPVELLTASTQTQAQTKVPAALPKLPDMMNMNKLSDASLQSRMFASARDYKMVKKSPSSSTPQVHAMIASRGLPPSKGGLPQSRSEEIQCGYKWSGSGGQVKERTQMVRELVPLDVMATYLNKPFPQQPQTHLSHLLSVQQEAGALPSSPVVLRDSKGSRLVLGTARTFLPQHLKSLPKFPTPTSPHEQMPSQVDLALNLTTPKQNSQEVSPKQTAPRPKRQSKRSSQSAQAMQQKAAATVAATLSSVGDVPSSPTSTNGQSTTTDQGCTYSSPSLAAMLRLPAMSTTESLGLTSTLEGQAQTATVPAQTTVGTASKGKRQKSAPIPDEVIYNSNGLDTGSNLISAADKTTPASCKKSISTGRRNTSSSVTPRLFSKEARVKAEPYNAYSPPLVSAAATDQETAILCLPIKSERRESQTSTGSLGTQATEREDSQSPRNLVMDLQMDTVSSVTSASSNTSR